MSPQFAQNKVEILSFKNNKILEAGCGSGNDGIRLAKLDNNLVLLDGSISALNYAKRGRYVIVGIPNPRNPEIFYSRWSGAWKSIENNYYEENLYKL